MSSNSEESGPFPHIDRVVGRSGPRAKFDCPGCGRVLDADYRNPFYLEALERARAFSGATPRSVGGRCPVCDGPMAKRRQRPKDDSPDTAPDPPAPKARGPRKERGESRVGTILGLPPIVWIAAAGAGALFLLGIVGVVVVILVLPGMAGSAKPKYPAPWAPGLSPPPASDVFAGGPAVYLADVQEFGVRAGPWPFAKNGQVRGDKPIQLNGVPSPQGLSMHPPMAPGCAAARYRLGKRAAVLRAVVAIDDTSNGCFSPAVFTVLGDGKALWQSTTIAPQAPHVRSQECSVNVAGVDVLELHVECINGNPGVHAVWVQPRLLQRADTPDPEAARQAATPTPAPAPSVPPKPADNGVGTAAATPPGEVPPASDFRDLLGYWSFDEVTPAGQVADLSGRGNHGMARGAASAQGVKGKALAFNGRDASFDYGSSADFNFAANAPFTFACWVKTQAHSGNVVAQRNGLDGGAVIALTVEQRMASCTIRQDRELLPAKVMSKQPVADGAWHHLAVTRKADGSVELFFDGASQGVTNVPSGKGPITTDHRALAVEPTWAKQGHQSYIGIQTYLEATLDEFCIFNRPLTIEEIKKLAGR